MAWAGVLAALSGGIYYKYHPKVAQKQHPKVAQEKGLKVAQKQHPKVAQEKGLKVAHWKAFVVASAAAVGLVMMCSGAAQLRQQQMAQKQQQAAERMRQQQLAQKQQQEAEQLRRQQMAKKQQQAEEQLRQQQMAAAEKSEKIGKLNKQLKASRMEKWKLDSAVYEKARQLRMSAEFIKVDGKWVESTQKGYAEFAQMKAALEEKEVEVEGLRKQLLLTLSS